MEDEAMKTILARLAKFVRKFIRRKRKRRGRAKLHWNNTKRGRNRNKKKKNKALWYLEAE